MVGFDKQRAFLKDPDFFSRFTISRTATPLSAAHLPHREQLLLFERGREKRALLVRQMAYHHVAQGELANEPFLVAFWVVCNSGVGLTPLIDGALHHFSAGGLYNGLVLLIDDETRSYWDHIRGEAVWGPLTGRRMPTWGVQLTTVGQALAHAPDLLLLRSRQTMAARLISWFLTLPWTRNTLPPGFRKTMGPPDRRLPEMEIGLGVVAEQLQRFYPLAQIGTGLVDRWHGLRLHIAVDPVDSIPQARFADGSRPFQVFTRWYGFAFTYPDCEIFGQ